mgnify:CR=1 FL=1
MRLTKRSVEGLPLKAESYIIWDGDVKGFGVRIYPSGKRSYIIQYRSGTALRRQSSVRHLTDDSQCRLDVRYSRHETL